LYPLNENLWRTFSLILEIALREITVRNMFNESLRVSGQEMRSGCNLAMASIAKLNNIWLITRISLPFSSVQFSLLIPCRS